MENACLNGGVKEDASVANLADWLLELKNWMGFQKAIQASSFFAEILYEGPYLFCTN